MIGRLFGSQNVNATKTEIVLLITPRVLRNIARPGMRFEEFPSGTENAVGAAPLLLQGLPISDASGATIAPFTITAASAPASAPIARVLLQAPANVRPGAEFTVQVTLDSEAPLRNGNLNFTFDSSRLRLVGVEAGSLLQSTLPESGFRYNAPAGAGRITVGISSSGDIRGSGELARLRFQAITDGPIPSSIRLDALSLTDSMGRVITAQLPPPPGISMAR